MKKIAVLLSIITLASCGLTTDKKNQADNTTPEVINVPVPSDWKTFSKEDYSIQYPPTWELNQKQEGTLFTITAPIDSTNIFFVENINLIKEDLKDKGDVDLDKYTEAGEVLLKSYLTNYTLISSKKLKDAAGEYQQTIFSGDQDSIHIMFEQRYRIINKVAYVLTLTDSKNHWPVGQPVGEQILGSFKIKN